MYLTSVDALEHGQKLGEDVFAPQPPVFYLLLRLISLAGADSVRGFHWGMVVVAIATCLAAYLLGRALAGPLAGPRRRGAADDRADLRADRPPGAGRRAAARADAARLLARVGGAAAGAHLRPVAAAAGAALALAVATKPNAALALPTFLLLLLWRNSRSGASRSAASLGGAAAVSTVLLLAYRDVLGELWESVVDYHRDARDTPAVVDRSHELATFLNWKTPFAWLLVAGLAGSILLLRRRGEAVWALWAWAAVSLAFVALPPSAAPQPPRRAAGRARAARGDRARRARPARAPGERPRFGALALVLAAGYVQQQRRLAVADVPEQPELVAAAETLRRVTGPDDLVVSDQPLVPFLADRRVWGPLVDTANLRFQTGSLTAAEVLRELDEGSVEAVVVGRSFLRRPAVLAGIRDRYRRVEQDGGVSVWVRR